jgi:hypothetical protein
LLCAPATAAPTAATGRPPTRSYTRCWRPYEDAARDFAAGPHGDAEPVPPRPPLAPAQNVRSAEDDHGFSRAPRYSAR